MDFQPIPIEDVLTISKKDLEAMAENGGRSFCSEFQSLQAGSDIKYSIALVYNLSLGNEASNSDMFSVYVCFSHANKSIQLRCKFGFYVKSAGMHVKSEMDAIMVGLNHWAAPIVSLTEILNPEKNFIADDKLTLHMKGLAFIEPVGNTMVAVKSRLTLAQLLWEREDRDFVIAVAGKEDEAEIEIKIHKLVLASRSDVFDRMLETDMKEKADSKLKIIDFEADVVQAAVDYFYDRDAYTLLDFESLLNLLQFSDKYDIKDFKTEIERVLLTHLYPDTICQIANASITSNSAALKDLCIQTMIIYIKQGVPIKNVETLEKDFVTEMLKKTAIF